MAGKLVPFRQAVAKTVPLRERLAASKPRFDQEHCEDCHRMFPRGTVRLIVVNPNDRTADAYSFSAYRFLCIECRRKFA